MYLPDLIRSAISSIFSLAFFPPLSKAQITFCLVLSTNNPLMAVRMWRLSPPARTSSSFMFFIKLQICKLVKHRVINITLKARRIWLAGKQEMETDVKRQEREQKWGRAERFLQIKKPDTNLTNIPLTSSGWRTTCPTDKQPFLCEVFPRSCEDTLAHRRLFTPAKTRPLTTWDNCLIETPVRNSTVASVHHFLTTWIAGCKWFPQERYFSALPEKLKTCPACHGQSFVTLLGYFSPPCCSDNSHTPKMVSILPCRESVRGFLFASRESTSAGIMHEPGQPSSSLVSKFNAAPVGTSGASGDVSKEQVQERFS